MKRLTDYFLHTPFETVGLWTPNVNELDGAVNGILTFEKGVIRLKLMGNLAAFKNKRMLYGYTEDGHYIWIPYFSTTNVRASDQGFAVNEFPIPSCFIFEDDASNPFETIQLVDTFKQIFIHGQNDFKVQDLTFSTNHLLEWVGQSILHENIVEKDKLVIPYGIVKSRTFELSKHLLLQLQLNQETTNDVASIFARSTAEVRIEAHTDQAIWFQQLLQEVLGLVKLIDFLGGRINQFQYIRFEVQAGIRGTYLFEQTRNQTHYTDLETHTTLKDVDQQFDRVLLNYTFKKNKLDLIMDDYLSEFYLEAFYETKLLNSIRNLEIFHRNFIEPKLAEKIDTGQEVAREKIVGFINQNIPEKYQGRFRSQVYYKPEKSLRKRLDYLIKNLPDEVFDKLQIKSATKRKSRSIGSFVNRIVETRHYFTHGDFPENYPNRLKDLTQVKRANTILRKICLYYVYQELGMANILENKW